MPFYEYKCPSCNKHKELLRRMSEHDQTVLCLTCSIPMKRVYTPPMLNLISPGNDKVSSTFDKGIYNKLNESTPPLPDYKDYTPQMPASGDAGSRMAEYLDSKKQ